jgi:hypothetical protein
MSLFPE